MATNIAAFSKLIVDNLRRQKETISKQVAALSGEDFEYKGKKAKLVSRNNLPDGTVYRMLGLYIERNPSRYYAIEYSSGSAFGGDSKEEAKAAFESSLEKRELIDELCVKLFSTK